MKPPGLQHILWIHVMVSDSGMLLNLPGVALLGTVWSFVLTSALRTASSCLNIDFEDHPLAPFCIRPTYMWPICKCRITPAPPRSSCPAAASLPGRDLHRQKYATLPSRTRNAIAVLRTRLWCKRNARGQELLIRAHIPIRITKGQLFAAAHPTYREQSQRTA